MIWVIFLWLVLRFKEASVKKLQDPDKVQTSILKDNQPSEGIKEANAGLVGVDREKDRPGSDAGEQNGRDSCVGNKTAETEDEPLRPHQISLSSKGTGRGSGTTRSSL